MDGSTTAVFTRLLVNPILANQKSKGGRLTNNRNLPCIIMLGVQCVEVKVAHGIMQTNQQSGTSSTHQSENMTRVTTIPPTAPMAMGSSVFSCMPRPTGGICLQCRPTCHCFAKTLACYQTFSLPLSTFRKWLSKMTVVAEVSSHASESMGGTSQGLPLA